MAVPLPATGSPGLVEGHPGGVVPFPPGTSELPSSQAVVVASCRTSASPPLVPGMQKGPTSTLLLPRPPVNVVPDAYSVLCENEAPAEPGKPIPGVAMFQINVNIEKNDNLLKDSNIGKLKKNVPSVENRQSKKRLKNVAQLAQYFYTMMMFVEESKNELRTEWS